MMKHLSLLLFTMLTLFGCVQEPNYTLATSSMYINEIQILDPEAPSRNDGITTSLEGNYGKQVMTQYQKSAYQAKTARSLTQASE